MKLWESTFNPLGTLVVLQMFKVTETRGGIQLPDTAHAGDKIESPRGLVVAVGPDCKCGLKRGDEVLLTGGRYSTVIHQGREVVVLTEDKIVGLVPPEDEAPTMWERAGYATKPK